MPFDLPLVTCIEVGETADLGGRYAADLTFTSRDPRIASVSDTGDALGISPGTATITVARDGETQEIALTVVPESAAAPPHPAGPHPRLRYTADDLAARQALIAQGSLPGLGIDLAATARDFLARADALVAEDAIAYEFAISGETFGYRLPYPPAQPAPRQQPYGFRDYPFWTRLSRQIEDRLVHLTLAWSLTGDTRYAEKAKQILLGIAGWDKWHEYDKATNNLSLPHFTIGAATAYDELYDTLSEAERQQVRNAIVHLGLRPMSYWFDRHLDHNIAVLMNAAMLFACLAIGDETPHLGKYLDHSVEMLGWYLRQREEGTTTEGLTYTSYAMSTVLRAGNALQRVLGRDDLLRSPFIRDELPDFFLYQFAGDGGYANLADTHNDLHPVGILALLIAGTGDPRAAWLLHQEENPGPGLLPHIDHDVEMPDFASLDYPLARRFDRIDWVAMRSGWTGNDTVVVFTAGPSAVGHNHFDQNHFVLAVGGEWVVTDPGYQNYTPGPEAFFTNDTRGHNALLVNGEGQSSRGKARIVTTDFGDRIATVTGDATGAYDGRVRSWRRTLHFARDAWLLVVDEIVPADPADRLSLLWHTTGQVRAAGEPLPIGAARPADTAVTFAGQRHQVEITTWSSAGHTIRHQQHAGAERFGTWIALEPAPAATHLVASLFRFDPAAQDPAPLTVTPGETTTIEVGTDRFVLRQPAAEGSAHD